MRQSKSRAVVITAAIVVDVVDVAADAAADVVLFGDSSAIGNKYEEF